MPPDARDSPPPPTGRPVRPFLPETPADEATWAGRPDRHRSGQTSGVRPYLLTGGRARPVDAGLEIEAQVVTTDAGFAALDRYAYEPHAIIAACRQPMAVVEVASRLGLHLGVARVLVGDLVALGHLAVRRPDPGLRHNTQTIERVIRGLQTIR